MAKTPGPDEPCEFKKEGGLGGWRRGTVVRHLDGGRKVEVREGRQTHVVVSGRVREAPDDGRTEARAAAQAEGRRQHVERREREDEITQEMPLPTKAERIQTAREIVSIPKPEGPARDSEYLAFVRKHPCCACGHVGPDIEAHHFGPRGMGQKTSDYLAVPLCFEHHEEFHQKGTIACLLVPLAPALRAAQVARTYTEHAFYRSQAMLLCAWVSRTVPNVL